MSVTDRELSAIVENLFVDDAVDMLEELPANVVKRVLKAPIRTPASSSTSFELPGELSREHHDRRVYGSEEVHDGGAGHQAHPPTGEESESIYTCYVTDASRRLEGVLTVKELLLAGDEETVADLMETDLITAETTEDREEAVARMMKYDLITMPWWTGRNRLVGHRHRGRRDGRHGGGGHGGLREDGRHRPVGEALPQKPAHSPWPSTGLCGCWC